MGAATSRERSGKTTELSVNQHLQQPAIAALDCQNALRRQRRQKWRCRLPCLLLSFGTAIACSPSFATQSIPAFDIQGHRGARGLWPENTTDGFVRTSDFLWVHTLEMDVVVAADSTVVVSHEPWMAEQICSDVTGRAITNGKIHNIYRMTYSAVARYDCGSRRHPDFPHQMAAKAAKARLEDVIRMVEAHTRDKPRSPLRYNIEIKSRPDWDNNYTPDVDVFVQLVHRVVAEAGVENRVTIQSFDRRALLAARRSSNDWQVALLVIRVEALPETILGLGFTPDVLSPAYQHVTESLVNTAHALGMRVIPWTVNATSEMLRLKAVGVDGVITDYPDRALVVAGDIRD